MRRSLEGGVYYKFSYRSAAFFREEDRTEDIKRSLADLLADIDKLSLKETEDSRPTKEDDRITTGKKDGTSEKKDTALKTDDTKTPKEETTPSTGDEGKSKFWQEINLDPTVFKRELKIKGQIGHGGEKLSYISLMHQMGEARRSDYKDVEIISAVVKAMVPGL